MPHIYYLIYYLRSIRKSRNVRRPNTQILLSARIPSFAFLYLGSDLLFYWPMENLSASREYQSYIHCESSILTRDSDSVQALLSFVFHLCQFHENFRYRQRNRIHTNQNNKLAVIHKIRKKKTRAIPNPIIVQSWQLLVINYRKSFLYTRISIQ